MDISKNFNVTMKQFYITKKDGSQEGPYDESGLAGRVQAGKYDADTLVWSEGMETWEALGEHFSLPEQRVVIPPPLPPGVVPSLPDDEPPPPPLPKQKKINLEDIGKTIKKTAEDLNKVGKNVAAAAGQATGLERLDDFSFKHFCKEIFRRHTLDEVIDFFICGTSRTTPPLQEVSATWPAPWIFSRILLFFTIIYVGFCVAINEWGNQNLVPGCLFVGCFAIPFCVAIFFYEMNVKRDMPFFEIVKAFMMGGLFSLIITLFFFQYLGIFEGAWWAGFMEEPAKLLATLMIVSPMYRRGNILHGMAVGCAVGAGFAAFETAGYVYRYMSVFDDLHMAAALQSVDVINYTLTAHGIPKGMSDEQFMYNPDENVRLMIRGVDPDTILWIRGLYAPFCHVIWSAITAGAFWHVMSKRENEPDRKSWNVDISAISDKLTFGMFKYSMNFSGAANGEAHKNHLNIYVLADYRFWAIFACPVLLHAIWNSSILESWGIIRNVGIGVAGWAIALLLLQMGIRQVRREKENLEQQAEAPSESET